jgi:hypothetical protein
MNVYSSARNLSAAKGSASDTEKSTQSIGTPAATTPASSSSSAAFSTLREPLLDGDDLGTGSTPPTTSTGGNSNTGNGPGANLGLALSFNLSEIDNLALNNVSGVITAKDFSLTAQTKIDYVYGAGNIHLSLGAESISNALVPSFKGKNQGWTKSGLQQNGISSAIREFISLGNVAKNGVGAAISVLLPRNQASNNLLSGAILNLSGSIAASALQLGKAVSVVVGSGESEQFGLSGGIKVLSGDGNITTNNLAPGVSLSAYDAILNAQDDILNVDVAGVFQYSNKIGVGFSLIVNDLKRQTKNTVAAAAGSALVLKGEKGLSAGALQSGTVVTAAIAGALQNGSKLSNDNQTGTANNAESGGKLAALLERMPNISGSGSIAINSISDTVSSSMVASTTGNLPVSTISTPSTSQPQVDRIRLQGQFREGDQITGKVSSTQNGRPIDKSFTFTVQGRRLPVSTSGVGSSQQIVVDLSSEHHAGDRIDLTFSPTSGGAITVSHTVTDTSSMAIANALATLVNERAGLGAGPGAFAVAGLGSAVGQLQLRRLGSNTLPFTVTARSTGADLASLRSGLIAAINGSDGFGTDGSDLASADSDPDEVDSVLLTARNAIRHFTSSAVVTQAAGSLQPVTMGALNLSARDDSLTINLGGSAAIALGNMLSTGRKVDSATSLKDGSFSLAGAAAVNVLERQVGTRLDGIDFGDTPVSLKLESITDDSATVAGAVSLSVGVSPSLSLSIAGSVAVNTTVGDGLDTTAHVSNVASNRLQKLEVQALDRSDHISVAGTLGLAIALNNQTSDTPTSTDASSSIPRTVAGSFGLGVAINDLGVVDTAALVEDASLITTSANNLPVNQSQLKLQASTEDVNLVAVSLAAEGSAASSTISSSSINLSGAAAGSGNSYSPTIRADLSTSSIAPQLLEPAPSLDISASSDESVLSVAGGVDVAVAQALSGGATSATSSSMATEMPSRSTSSGSVGAATTIGASSLGLRPST